MHSLSLQRLLATTLLLQLTLTILVVRLSTLKSGVLDQLLMAHRVTDKEEVVGAGVVAIRRVLVERVIVLVAEAAMSLPGVVEVPTIHRPNHRPL